MAAAEDDAEELATVVSAHDLHRSLLSAAVPAAAREEEEDDDDALFAEKIRLLQEENARLRAAQAASSGAEPGPDSEDLPLATAGSGVADWLLAELKERERAAAEAAAAAAAAEAAAAERARRGAVLAQLDAWVGEEGGALGPPCSELPPDDATPAALAALRVHLPKPRALAEGAAAQLARLEAEHASLLACAAAPPERRAAARAARAAAAQLGSLTEAMDELEHALASSAAAVAGAVGGSGAAGRVSAFYRRLVAAPPLVRLAFLLAVFFAFAAAVWVLNFFGGEAEEEEALLGEGVLFKRDALRVEAAVIEQLASAGAEGRAAAAAVAAEGELLSRTGEAVGGGDAGGVAAAAAMAAAARRLLRGRR